MEQLFYHCPAPALWRGTLERLCREEGIRAVFLTQADCARPLGSLLGLPVQGASPGGLPAEPVMIFSGFSGARMDAFLAALGRAGVPPVLKAVVTPTNLGWSVSTLIDELARERDGLG